MIYWAYLERIRCFWVQPNRGNSWGAEQFHDGIFQEKWLRKGETWLSCRQHQSSSARKIRYAPEQAILQWCSEQTDVTDSASCVRTSQLAASCQPRHWDVSTACSGTVRTARRGLENAWRIPADCADWGFWRGCRRVSENTSNGIAELHASAVCPVS